MIWFLLYIASSCECVVYIDNNRIPPNGPWTTSLIIDGDYDTKEVQSGKIFSQNNILFDWNQEGEEEEEAEEKILVCCYY